MTSPSPAEFGPQGAAYEELAQEALPTDDGTLGAQDRDRLVEFDNAARLEPDGRSIHDNCPLPPDELYSAG